MHSVEYKYAPVSNGIQNKNLVNQGDRPLRNVDNFIIFMLPNPKTELVRKSPTYLFLTERVEQLL